VHIGWQSPNIDHLFTSDHQRESEGERERERERKRERVVHLIGSTQQEDVTSGDDVQSI